MPNPPIYAFADTWDDAGTTYVGVGLDVTDTASAVDSRVYQFSVDGTPQLWLDKEGDLYIRDSNKLDFGDVGCSIKRASGQALGVYAFTQVKVALGNGDGQVRVISGGYLGWSSHPSNATSATADTALYRDATGVVAVRDKANTSASSHPGSVEIYNVWADDGVNTESVHMGFAESTNVFEIKPKASGTGTAREIHISGLPTSNPGPGILWNNGGTPAIGT